VSELLWLGATILSCAVWALLVAAAVLFALTEGRRDNE
jgi:hypothetical protein